MRMYGLGFPRSDSVFEIETLGDDVTRQKKRKIDPFTW